MKVCKNCEKTYTDDVNFCNVCGAKLESEQEAKIYCSACGKPLNPNALFCDACGEKVANDVPQGAPVLKKSTPKKEEKPKILVTITESADNPDAIPEEEREQVLAAKQKHANKKAIGTAKTVLKTLCNVFWIILYGLGAAITAVCTGIAYCAGLITIPCGIVSFKSVKLVFSPFKKRVVTHFGRKGFWNVIWLIFGGFAPFFSCKFLQLIFNVTFIGRPIGAQFGKLATFYLAPFGSQILTDDQFSSDQIEKYVYTRQYILRNQYDPSFIEAAEEIKKATKEKQTSDLTKKIVLASILGTLIIVAGIAIKMVGLGFGIGLALAAIIVGDYLLEFFTSKYIYEFGYGSRNDLISYYDTKSRFQKPCAERDICASYYPSIKNYVDTLVITEKE